MPKLGMREEFKLQTRDRFTNVECELGISIAGNELPSLAIIGDAMEKAMEIIQARVTELYSKVPERVG